MNGEFEGTWDIDGVRLAVKLARPFSMTKVVLGIAGLVGVLIATYVFLADGGGTLLPIGITFIVVLMAFVGLAMWQVPRQLHNSPAFQGTQRGTYSATGMVVSNNVATTEHNWSGFSGVKRHEQAVGFTYANKATLTILRRWFPTEEAWQTFLAVAERGVAQQGSVEPGNEAAEFAGAPPTATPAELVTRPEVNGTDEPASISFHGTWDDTALKSAVGAIAPARWLTRFVGPWLIAIVLLFRLSATSEGKGPGLGSVLPILIVMALGALFYLSLPHIYVRQMRKNVGGEAVDGIASEQGLQMKSATTGATANHWSTYTKAVITGDAVSLRFGSAAVPATALPRSWFASDDDWERFVALVYQHVRS